MGIAKQLLDLEEDKWGDSKKVLKLKKSEEYFGLTELWELNSYLIQIRVKGNQHIPRKTVCIFSNILLKFKR